MKEHSAAEAQDRSQSGSRAPRPVATMILPAGLLTLLILGFVVARGGAVEEPELRAGLPYLIAVNHTVVFVVLLLLLRREGRTLRSIGWRSPGDRPLWQEVALGLAAGLLFYLVKELVFDSVRALLAGARPTFTSLFRFRPTMEELPLLIVATSFIAVEESVYRGYGLAALRARWGPMPALLVMGVLFGLLHWGNGPLAILFTGTLGILHGVLFLWRRTLVAPVVAHALYNAFVVLT